MSDTPQGLDKDTTHLLDPIEHMQWALHLPPPTAFQPTPLTDAQLDYLQTLANNPGQLKLHVQEQLRYWTQRKSELESVTNNCKAALKPTQLATVGKINWFLVEE